MKKVLFIILFVLESLTNTAQTIVTKFLDIPVDGSKISMIQKLKTKGFIYDARYDGILKGEFNGNDVRVYLATNRKKIYRIMVCDANTVNESNIRIRFNNLLNQFINNKNYIMLEGEYINEKEDISYEIAINNKRYEAVFLQKSLFEDENTSEKLMMRPVWFMISEFYGEYYISIFYDNEYNRVHGEDL